MITFIFVCFTRRLNVTVLSPILYNLACVVDRLNPSLWTVIYSLRVLYLRKPRVISPTATQAVITTVFCICWMGSSLGLFFLFFIFSSQKCKMKTETTKLYIKQSILFFCKFATLISQDRSRLTTSAVQSITATSLFAWFCFCFDKKKTSNLWISQVQNEFLQILFTRLASIYADLSEQKKAFTYKKS